MFLKVEAIVYIKHFQNPTICCRISTFNDNIIVCRYKDCCKKKDMKQNTWKNFKIRTDFSEQYNSLIFFITFYGSYLNFGMSLWTMICHYICHKDIRDVRDNLTDTKDDP